GVRRIEAVSGAAAEKYLNTQTDQLARIAEMFKNPKDIIKAVSSLNEENAQLRKQLEKLESAQLRSLGQALAGRSEQINGTSFVGEVVEVNNADALKKLAFDLKQRL